MLPARTPQTVHFAAVLALLLAAPAAQAEEAVPNPTQNATVPKPDWDTTLGIGTWTSPRYPGARGTATQAVPYLDVTYKNRFFANNQDGAGVYFRNDDRLSAGLSLEYDFTERRTADDARLAGLGDVKRTPRAHLFSYYTHLPFVLNTAVSKDAGGHGEGTLVDLNANVALPVTKDILFLVGPGWTWADSAYASTFFGVSPAQSQRSGLPVYAAGAGLRDAHWNLMMSANLDKHWQINASGEFARLRGAAAASPVTVSRQQNSLLMALAYKF